MAIKIFICLILLSINVQSATLERRDQSIVINGVLVEGDYESFIKIVKETTNAKVVVLNNCIGGLISVGFKISQLVSSFKLNTIAKGEANSACALVFLAGKERNFDSSFGVHSILLHAARNANRDINIAADVTAAMLRYIQYLSGKKISENILNLIEKSQKSNQGVVFLKENMEGYKLYKTVYCNGDEDGALAKCVELDNSDARLMGVVTDSAD